MNILRYLICFCLILMIGYGIGKGNSQAVFNEEDVKEILYYAYSAFCPVDQLESWECQWCDYVPNFQTVQVVDVPITGIYGYVGYVTSKTTTTTSKTKTSTNNNINNDDNNNDLIRPRIIASFRGSDDTQNWIVDLDFEPLMKYQNESDILVHPGFYQGYLEIQEIVRKAVLSITLKLCPLGGCDVICTGHSLGAALSSFCAADLAQFSLFSSSIYPSLSKLNVSLINFGQPRTGNFGWAQFFNQTVLGNNMRLVNNDDPVPHVPPRHLFLYHHFPYEIWELPNNTYITCDSSGEDPHCCDSLKPWQLNSSNHLIYLGVPNNNCGT